MKSRLAGYFSDYEAYHRTAGNKVCHALGIPMILVSTLGLLSLITVEPGSLFRLDGGVALWAIASAWYFRLDWRLAAPFSCLTLAGYFLGRALSLQVLIGVFVVGWILQGVGHAVYEKRSPAFFRNGTHLLIGPFWIFASAFRSKK